MAQTMRPLQGVTSDRAASCVVASHVAPCAASCMHSSTLTLQQRKLSVPVALSAEYFGASGAARARASSGASRHRAISRSPDEGTVWLKNLGGVAGGSEGFRVWRFARLGGRSHLGRTDVAKRQLELYVSAALDIKTDLKAKDVQAGVQPALPQGETWSVHKFGCTCVGTTERIWNVAGIIVDDASLRKVVVVSAMSKVTDMMYDVLGKAQCRDDSYVDSLELIREKHLTTATALLGNGEELDTFLERFEEDILNLKAMLRAIYIAGNATESFSDFVAGHGELWSAQMLAAAVRKRGLSCVWMDARDVLVVSPMNSNQVDLDFEMSLERLTKWYAKSPANTIIATGFIASTPQNVPTTLERDGRDFSAAIMVALFRAGRVTIWTDVNGVYSPDPRKDAVILSTLLYQEAWETSYFGANVLHPRATIPVMKYNIPITIRNVFDLSAAGTIIWHSHAALDNADETNAAVKVVKGFATIDNMALINVEGTGMAGVPGTDSTILGTVEDVGASVVMTSQASSEHSLCFAVPEKEPQTVAKALEKKFRRALDAGRLSKSEKLMLGAAVKNAVGDIRPVANSAEKGFVLFTRRFFHVLETLAARILQVGDAAREAVQKPNTQEEAQLLAALKGRMVCATAPLLVAAISQSVNTPLTVVASGMAKWLELYSGVLMVRVLLSWFPNIPWERQPLQAMRDMCDPYLNLFRNIIPPLFNALDLSPMLAFLVLGVLTSILNTTVQAT